MIKTYLTIVLLAFNRFVNWIYRNTVKWLYRRWIQYLLEQQVKKAVRLSKIENRRYIVTMFFGRPVCLSKQQLKEAIKRRKFRKGVTIQTIEQQAYFVTH